MLILPPRDREKGPGLHQGNERSDEDLIQDFDSSHRRVSSAQGDLFKAITDVDRRRAWRDSGARDMPHWLSMRLGISNWKARRWIAAAHAIESLPFISQALSSGELGMEKVVELTRFAAPETERNLLRWAKGSPPPASGERETWPHPSPPRR